MGSELISSVSSGGVLVGLDRDVALSLLSLLLMPNTVLPLFCTLDTSRPDMRGREPEDPASLVRPTRVTGSVGRISRTACASDITAVSIEVENRGLKSPRRRRIVGFGSASSLKLRLIFRSLSIKEQPSGMRKGVRLLFENSDLFVPFEPLSP